MGTIIRVSVCSVAGRATDPGRQRKMGGHAFLVSGNPTAARLLRETGLAVHELELDGFGLADGGPICLVNVLP